MPAARPVGSGRHARHHAYTYIKGELTCGMRRDPIKPAYVLWLVKTARALEKVAEIARKGMYNRFIDEKALMDAFKKLDTIKRDFETPL